MSPPAVLDDLGVAALPLWPSDDAEPDSPREPEAVPSRTLQAAVEASWGALEAGFASACLLCGGAVHPRWSAGAGVVGGRCETCGTELE